MDLGMRFDALDQLAEIVRAELEAEHFKVEDQSQPVVDFVPKEFADDGSIAAHFAQQDLCTKFITYTAEFFCKFSSGWFRLYFAS